MGDRQFKKYTFYAIGEIFLVVVGILIALQINNWNEAEKIRKRELIYLGNIEQDLELNLISLDEFIRSRNSTVKSVEYLLKYFEGESIDDLRTFNQNNVNVLVWYPFIQNANTFNELMNSGNLSIISNSSIRNELQNMQTQYATIGFIENEMQQDYERYLYEVYFDTNDLNTAIKNLEGGEREDSQIDINEINILLESKRYKNGLVLAKFNSNILIEEYGEMISRTNNIISLIRNEIGD